VVFSATVGQTWDETPTLRGVRLGVGPAAGTHARAGQFVQVRCGASTGTFALASLPGDDHFELLVRSGGEAADGVRALAVGDPVEVSEARGAGYPLELARGSDLLLVAAGSGIGPIRSAVLSVLTRPHEFGRVTLFYGEKQPDDLAYAREMAAWELGGVVVRRVLSRAPHSWTGARGHVQEAIESQEMDLRRVHAFVTGMSEMMQAVTAKLVAKGLPAGRIHRNV